ncbi:MAG: hypothetical protein ACLFPD_05775 [Desulfosudaceae bacterium]
MALENDIVLIHQENSPMAFARIEEITADHKKDWFQVRLLILSVPLQEVTWILREEYINGLEFMMDGRKMRLEKVVAPSGGQTVSPAQTDATEPESDHPGPGARVISFPEKSEKS